MAKKKHRIKKPSPSRKEIIAALGLAPEGNTRGEKYAYTTAEYMRDLRKRESPAHRKARKKLGITKS